MKIWNIWITITKGVSLSATFGVNKHKNNLWKWTANDSFSLLGLLLWKCSKKSRRSWALDKQGISIYANKGMGMNNSFQHSGCHAVYVRSRKYAHYFLNNFSRQFLETLYNFPPMLIEDRIDSRLFNWHVTILEHTTSQMRMMRNGHIKQTTELGVTEYYEPNH